MLLLRLSTLLCLSSVLLCWRFVKAGNTKESSSKLHDKPKQEAKKLHHKSDTGKKPLQQQGDKNNDNNEDYDTSQGYPILYPETHMMSLKRNVTTQGTSNATQTSFNISKAGGTGGVEETPLNDNNTQRNTTTSSLSSDEEHTKCSKTLDLLFLLDSSESVKYSNWKIMVEFVKDLCNRFHLNSTRVAFIRYASEAEISIPLTQFNSTEDRDAAIDNIFYKTGGTRTDIALKKAMEVFQIGEQRSQVVMLLTDGPTNRLEINKDHFVEGRDLVAAPAERLKEAGIALFCIGIEPDSETPEEIEIMKEEMAMIASEPTKQHLFISDGYHELQRKVQSVSQAACVVNGGWSRWSEFSPCSVTCGYGTKVRMRTCTNPSPENNGADCSGPRVEVEECDLGPCKIQTDQSPGVPVSATPVPLIPIEMTTTSTEVPVAQSVVPVTLPTVPVTPSTTVSVATTIKSTMATTVDAPDSFALRNKSQNSTSIYQQQNSSLYGSKYNPNNSTSPVLPEKIPVIAIVKNESMSSQQDSPTASAASNSAVSDLKNSSIISTSLKNSSDLSEPDNTTVHKLVNAQVIKNNTEPTKSSVVITGITTSATNASTGNTHSTIEGPCKEGIEELRLNDTQYSASSVYSHDTDDEYVKREYAPPNARLNNEINGGSWCAEHKHSINDDKDQYLQFDLGKQMIVDAIATQGSHLLENWIKKYNLRYSDDGKSWQFYAKNPLVGNVDQNSIQRNTLSPQINARYIQINPIEWYEGNGNEADKHDICMRAALFKCKDDVASPAVKRGYINSIPTTSYYIDAKHGKRGVIITEKHWSHLPGQKTSLTLTSVRNKRNTPVEQQSIGRLSSTGHYNHQRYHKGHKRILHRIRKIAKNIMKKIKMKSGANQTK